MRIIIDGPDGTGKTTLIKMYEAAGFKLFYHSSKISAHDRENDYNIMMDYFDKHPDENIIVDRLFFSHYVYGTIFKEELVPKEVMKKLSSYFDMAIFAIPYDKILYTFSFIELKKTREEMYDEIVMSDVYDMYENIYRRKDDFMNEISSNLVFVRYDRFMNRGIKWR